jgi:hypothetical protein
MCLDINELLDVQVLHAEGAREVYACATHAVFSPPATERLSGGVFQEVIVTNTIPVASELQFPCLTVLSVRLLSPAGSRLCCSQTWYSGDKKWRLVLVADVELASLQVANLLGETIWRVYASSSVLGIGQ